MSEIIDSPPKSFNPTYARDRASLTAMEIMEIVQDGYPDIVQNEHVYGLTICRIARVLRGHDTELKTDIIRQFSD